MIKKTWSQMTDEEREEYVNQDHVTRRETLISKQIDYSASFPGFVSNEEAILGMYFNENKSVMEITRELRIDQAYVSRIVSKYKELILVKLNDYNNISMTPNKDFEVIRHFFIDQMTEEEVAEIIDISQRNVSKIIDKFKKFLLNIAKK